MSRLKKSGGVKNNTKARLKDEMSAILPIDLSNLKMKYIWFWSAGIGWALVWGNYAISGIEISIGLKKGYWNIPDYKVPLIHNLLITMYQIALCDFYWDNPFSAFSLNGLKPIALALCSHDAFVSLHRTLLTLLPPRSPFDFTSHRVHLT